MLRRARPALTSLALRTGRLHTPGRDPGCAAPPARARPLFLTRRPRRARAAQYYADRAEALDAGASTDVVLPDDRFTCRVIKEPLGVVALITPWNYPLLCAPPRGGRARAR